MGHRSIYGVTTAPSSSPRSCSRSSSRKRAPDRKTIYIEPEQPVAERLCGKLPWPFPRRVFEPGTTVDLDRNAGSGGRLPAGVQSGEAAQPGWATEPGGFAAPGCPSPAPGRASPSLRWGWTTNRQKHKLNHVPGLTHGLGQKIEAGQPHNTAMSWVSKTRPLCPGQKPPKAVNFAILNNLRLLDFSWWFILRP